MALKLEEHCTILGEADEETTTNYFKTCDLFVLPCRTLPDGDTEGFGLVFLEANACGKPVVAGAAGGTIEAVADSETGLLVDGNDPAKIAEATIRILSDCQLASRLGLEGRRRAEASGWDTVTKRFLDLAGTTEASEPIRFSFEPKTFAFPLQSDQPPQLVVTVDVEEQFEWDRFSKSEYHVHGAKGAGPIS